MAFGLLRKRTDETGTAEQATVARIRRAVAGEKRAKREIVDELMPIIQKHVLRVLMRFRRASGNRDIRQDRDDFLQDVLLALFKDEGRELLRWDPAQGSAFATYIGIVTEREVFSILRSKRRNPWTEEPIAGDEIDLHDDKSGAETLVASKQMFEILWERMRSQLSDEGFQLFHMILVDERPVEEICAITGKKPDAVYQWRGRLLGRARTIQQELLSESEDARRMTKGSVG